MKTSDELKALKNEHETLNKQLMELTGEEVEQLSGGEDREHNYTVLACDKCD